MVNHGKPTVICGPSQLSGAADHLELGLHPWQRPASARDTETLFRAADFLCALAETTPLEMMLALCLQYIIFKGPQGPHFLWAESTQAQLRKVFMAWCQGSAWRLGTGRKGVFIIYAVMPDADFAPGQNWKGSQQRWAILRPWVSTRWGLGRTSALILLDYPLVHDDSKPSSLFYLNLFGWCCYLLLTHERILADGQDGLKKMAQAQAARSVTSPFTRNICQRRAAEVKLVGPGFLIWRAAYLTLRLGKAIGKANHQGVPCQCQCQCQCHAHSHKSRGCGTRCRCRGPQQKPMRWW